jgi:hypothetical protein
MGHGMSEIYLASDDPVDVCYVESLWEAAADKGEVLAASYLRTIYSGLVGEHAEAEEWSMTDVVNELKDVFGEEGTWTLAENMQYMTDYRAPGFGSSVISLALISALIHQLMTQTPAFSGSHPLPGALN